MSEANGWKWKLPIEAKEQDVSAKTMRDFSKWILDLLRNIIIVAVIQYMETRTDSVWVKAASFVSYGALFMYCGSYILGWTARSDMGKSGFARGAIYTIVSFVLVLVLIAANITISHVVNDVAKLQGR
jgi:hypothetical protein